MAASEAVISRSTRSGMAALEPAQGLHALAALLAAAARGKPATTAAAVPADWGIILKQVLCCHVLLCWLHPGCSSAPLHLHTFCTEMYTGIVPKLTV